MTATTTSAAGIQDAARHLAEGRPAAAVDVLERLVADFPAYVTAYALLAKAYEANGRTEDALDAWHHAYFLMPGSPLVLRERTRLLRSTPDDHRSVPQPEPEAAEEPASDESDDALEADVAPVEAAITYITGEPAEEPEPTGESALDDTIGEADDLDSLIHQLENAPRIRPDPDFRDESIEEGEEEEEGMVSETLARIYATQKQYAAAARAYEQLAEEHPDRGDEFEAKAAEMRNLSGSSDAKA